MQQNKFVDELFDLEWYAGEVGRQFSSRQEAIRHYVDTGEAAGYFPNPLFDPSYYRNQYNLPNGVNAFIDFCETGIEQNRDPNAYFLTDWYGWQNPESEAYACPLLHYLAIGGKEFRDPSPFVDMVLLRRNADSGLDGTDLLSGLVRGDRAADIGICLTQRELALRQRVFFDNIRMDVLKELPSHRKKKYLLWVQCSVGAEFFKWFRSDKKEWDLLINYYDSSNDRSDVGEYILTQSGTKFTAIFNVWRYTDIFEGYQYILFIDDDLIFKFRSIDDYFSYVSRHQIDLSQPSLTAGSYCVWPVLFNKRSKGHRYTNGVEIMMPAFSARCLSIMVPYFSMSISGFGLDLLFAKLASDNELKVAVIDAVKATHNSQINQETGAYYELLRNFGINSKYELWSLMQRYSLEKEFYETG